MSATVLLAEYLPFNAVLNVNAPFTAPFHKTPIFAQRSQFSQPHYMTVEAVKASTTLEERRPIDQPRFEECSGKQQQHHTPRQDPLCCAASGCGEGCDTAQVRPRDSEGTGDENNGRLIAEPQFSYLVEGLQFSRARSVSLSLRLRARDTR